jgi:Amino acid transporters
MAAVTNAVDQEAGRTSDKLTLLPLVALVVGSMIGGGVFNLPSDMSRHASPGAIVIGWVITGIGMLMLAFVYQGLAVRKPNLNAGPYAYAKAGFGDFIGFNSAWGYWISAFLGNVAYAVAIFSALSLLPPVLRCREQSRLDRRRFDLPLADPHPGLTGVKQAAFVNIVTTVRQARAPRDFPGRGGDRLQLGQVPLRLLGPGRHRRRTLGSVMDQVKSTMLVTLWVFIGIEGASVYSARAANRADVGRATLLGFAGALAIYVLVSLLARGLMTQPELAGLKVPSMAGVLEAAVGGWGAALINLGLIVSVGGAFLAWTLLCAEIPYVCGKEGTFPKWFAGENAAGSPVNSLWVTNGLIQIFLLVSYFSQNAYHFFYFIASVAILPPYVFSGAYALKLASRARPMARGTEAAIAT